MTLVSQRTEKIRTLILEGPRRTSEELGVRGRFLYGATPPGGGTPCERTSPLTDNEVREVVDIIATGHRNRRAVELPVRLRTRDWPSVEKVILRLDAELGRKGGGWKIGAASDEIRRAEGLPSPSPGRIYQDTIFDSGAQIGPELIINFRNVECEFAFELKRGFEVRDAPYDQEEVTAGIATLFPVLELGDTVFLDWYGASGYFGSCLDNGGGAALVKGARFDDWRSIDLAKTGMDLYLNEYYIKSGQGVAAMGNPLTSLTWMVNWARGHGLPIAEGEIVSTGTCTGHCFAARGDVVSADFGDLGLVQVEYL